LDCGGSHLQLFGFVMEKRSNPVATRRPVKKAAIESCPDMSGQQSRACGALYFVVTFLRTNFWQTA
jgi:hypothetical protein